ncbi:MAG TPA: hypothetical protein VFS67_11145 [Polyangiaceae bacterium]|nr:hypothetical protein [Polyangiaceae bacterium]
MDTPVPLVWNDHGQQTPTFSARIARVGSFITVLQTKTSQYETFSVSAPGCSIRYQGAIGARVLLEVRNAALSRQDRELPLVSFIRSTPDGELRLKTEARNDLARVMQKMSAYKSVGMLKTPARSTPRVMKWTSKGYSADKWAWEGKLADLVDDFATVNYSVTQALESYTISTGDCLFTYAGPRQTLMAVDLQDGEQRQITIDRRRGPETQFLVSAPTPEPTAAGVQTIARRVPGETLDSNWVSELQPLLDLDLGEFSPGSATRRSALSVTPYALVNRDRGTDDTLNMNTPSCSVLQGRIGNDLWIQVYDAASDAFVKVLRKDLGRGDHKIAIDTRGSPTLRSATSRQPTPELSTPPGAVLQ